MRVDKIANSGQDEFYTPEYAVEPLVRFVKPGERVWCPFDADGSAFVKVFKKNGIDVVATHIATGDDFFETERDCDYIISNPPYSAKTRILKRLYELNKPFAMLMGISGVFENSQRVELYERYGIQVLFLNPRVQYIDPINHKTGSPPYQSAYLCWKFLPADLMFARIYKDDDQIEGQMTLMDMPFQQETLF